MGLARLLVSVAVKAVMLTVAILATLATTVHVLATLGLDKRRAGELGVALSAMVVVYLFLKATMDRR
jgi:hypothetical protein